MQTQVTDLLDLQRSHFISFLKFSLKTELQTRHIWIQISYFEVTLYSNRLCFERPARDYKETIHFGGHYSTRLIIPRSFYDRRSIHINFEWVALGNLPLLTRQGNFFVNGTSRVSITQIVRGPGVYTNSKIENYGKSTFYLDLVPELGVWVRLGSDVDGYISLRIRKEQRLPLWLVLKTIGISFWYIAQNANKKNNLILENHCSLAKFSNFFFYKKKHKFFDKTTFVLDF